MLFKIFSFSFKNIISIKFFNTIFKEFLELETIDFAFKLETTEFKISNR